MDVYKHLLPRYFPSADKHDQELESSDQQGDEEEDVVKEKGDKDVHETEDEGETKEICNREEETEGLHESCSIISKT